MFTWLWSVHSVLWSVGKVALAKQRVLICWCSSWQFLGRWAFHFLWIHHMCFLVIIKAWRQPEFLYNPCLAFLSLLRRIIGRSRRRSCWSTAWWRLSGTLAPSSMTTPAALANTWRWSSAVEGRWSEPRYPSICWRNPESSTRRCKYLFLLCCFVTRKQTRTLMTALTLLSNHN